MVKSLFGKNFDVRDALLKIVIASKEDCTLDSVIKNVDCMLALKSTETVTSHAFFRNCIL